MTWYYSKNGEKFVVSFYILSYFFAYSVLYFQELVH